MGRSFVALRLALPVLSACAAHVTPPPAPPLVIAPAPPPKDEGRASGALPGESGLVHSAALEQLKVAPLLGVVDKQRSVQVLVPDARHWTRVKFFGIPTVLGLRYGKEHHAVIGVNVQHVDPDAPLAECGKAFEAWGLPLLDVFDVEVQRDPVVTFPWRHVEAELHTSFARTASLALHDGFAVAYATYPAWKGACLVVGIAVPARDDEPRARAARDRFAKDVLSRVRVTAKEEPKGRE